MSDPRVARGQPEMWPGGVVSPRSEIRTPMQLVHVELSCLNRRRGRLVWTGAPPQPEGSLHACSDKSCGTQISCRATRTREKKSGSTPMRRSYAGDAWHCAPLLRMSSSSAYSMIIPWACRPRATFPRLRALDWRAQQPLCLRASISRSERPACCNHKLLEKPHDRSSLISSADMEPSRIDGRHTADEGVRDLEAGKVCSAPRSAPAKHAHTCFSS